MIITRLIFLLANLLRTALSTSPIGVELPNPIQASTCAAPEDYTACIEDAANQQELCITAGGNTMQAIKNCGNQAQALNISCAITTCWNQVYSCEYQQFATYYGFTGLRNASDVVIPYFPPPENAPNSCSCNIGNIFEAEAPTDSYPLICNPFTLNLDADYVCACCLEALYYTAIFKICPSTNPDLIGYQLVNSFIKKYHAIPFDQCPQYLAETNCVRDLGFPVIAGSDDYLTAIPTSSGTQSLYNTGASILTPISPTVTFTGPGNVVYTLTASPAQISLSSNGGSDSGSSGVTGSTNGAQLTSAGSSASTGKPNGAESLDVRGGIGLMPWCMIVISVVTFFLS